MKFARILKHLEFNLIFSRVGLVWARPYPCPNEARSKSKNPSHRAPPTAVPSAAFASNFVARVRSDVRRRRRPLSIAPCPTNPRPHPTPSAAFSSRRVRSDGRRRRRRRPLSIAPLLPRIGESSLVRRLRLPPSLRQVRWRLRLLLPILRLCRLPCAPPSLRLPQAHALPSFPSVRPSPPPTIRTPQAHPSAIPAFSSASTPSRSPPCGRHLHARVWSACRNSGIVAPSRDAAASMPTSGAPPPTPVPPLWTGLPPPQPASQGGCCNCREHPREGPDAPPPLELETRPRAHRQCSSPQHPMNTSEHFIISSIIFAYFQQNPSGVA